ncbi:MAG: hypothetical protein LBC87_03420 [Fibromonadaceae bacterium]|jgi:hypothetical protein|nr:hypothetical protein [Fibromonadaceae bacterium]
MNKTKSILRLAISIALAFTFSCSSGGDGENNWSGGGVPFNENSQIYNEYCNYEDECHIGEAYKGNGVIKISVYSEDKDTLINAGSVKDGIVNLDLPTSIPNEYLRDFLSEQKQSYCTSYTKDIKVSKAYLELIDSDGKHIGDLNLNTTDEKSGENIMYWYFSKAGKIACTYNNNIYDIDAKANWNTIYFHEEWTANSEIEKWSTTNILTREMKWTITTYSY